MADIRCTLAPEAAILHLTGIPLSPATAALLVCADCGVPLERRRRFWSCGRGHGKLIPQGVLFCRLTGMPEKYLCSHDIDLYRKHVRDWAESWGKAHRGLVPQRLLKLLAQAMRVRRCRGCLRDREQLPGGVTWASADICSACKAALAFGTSEQTPPKPRRRRKAPLPPPSHDSGEATS